MRLALEIVGGFVILGLGGAVAILRLARGHLIWARDQARADRDDARRQLATLIGTHPLPLRSAGFNQQPPLPVDAVAQVLADLERHANGESR